MHSPPPLSLHASLSSSHPVSKRIPLTRPIHLDSGQTGLGKSTLINTIFASHLIDTKGRFEPDDPVRQTTEIQAVSHSKCLSLSLVCEGRNGEEDGL